MYDVTDHTATAAPFLLMTIGLEGLYYYFKDKDGLKSQKGNWNQGKFRTNDILASISQGSIQQLLKIFAGAFEISIYIYLWENWRIYPLQSNLATWFFTFIATDFCYYWFHRMAHEVNIMWAGHVIHHSSEYYNLSTALRHSVFQELCSWIFYMPMAFMIPPPMFAFHKQLNLFTQFWIHTETIPRLGWLEYIINTPSAHRVHHGRNPYCIDKNYAGALIIWDRMFGTYQDELVYPQVVDSKDKEEKVAYGITHPINTFNPLVIQTHHLRHVLTTAFSVKGIANKFKAVFFGPGWHEGTARLGDPEEIPKIEQSSPPVKYDPIIPFTMNLYCVIQTAATAGIADYVLLRLSSLPGVFLKLAAVWIFFAYYSLGSIMDRKPYFRELELFRLFAGVVLCNYVSSHSDLYQISRFIPWSLNILYLVSILFLIWTYISQKSK